MKTALKIVIVLLVILAGLLGIWFSLDKTTRCSLIYGRNICNFYAMMDIISTDSEKSNFEEAMQLCQEMEDVPKKDSCFEYIAQVVSFYDIEKAKEACNEIKDIKDKTGKVVHRKNDCYDKLFESN